MNTLRSILILGGAIFFGRFIEAALHELGHALVGEATGGIAYRIELNLFDYSFATVSTPTDGSSAAMLFGGAAFSVIVGLLLVGLSLEARSPYLLSFAVTGVFTFFNNGVYYLGWRDLESNGDPGQLLHWHGWPDWLLTLIAVFFLLLGLLALSRMAPLLGVSPEVSVWRRWGILLGGGAPFVLADLSYNGMLAASNLGLSLLIGLGVALAALFFAWLSRLGQDKEAPVPSVGILPLLFSVLLGILPFVIPATYVFRPFE